MNWRDVTGYEKYYEVSDTGLIRSKERVVYSHNQGGKYITKRKPRYLTTKPHKLFGYVDVKLTDEKGSTKTYKSHRLVAEAFIPNPHDKQEVNHLNGIKHDNRVVNLEWCTPSENTQHAYDTGLIVREGGDGSVYTKLNTNDVLFIRYWISKGYSYSVIAKLFNTSTSNIGSIKTRKSWRRVE